MRTSRVKFLASRTQTIDESEEEDYDSEEERYQWKQQRLLKKVEESATFIRTVNEITRPFVTGMWRLEREEQRNADLAASLTLNPIEEKKVQSVVVVKPIESWTGSGKSDNSKKKIVWSPVQHVTTTDVQSVLETEKAWKPLRKSKVRQSLVSFNTENACGSPVVQEEDLTSACKSLDEQFTPLKAPGLKSGEEVRTPLRAVVALNQELGRKKSIAMSNDSTSVPFLSESESHASNDTFKADNCVTDLGPTGTDSMEPFMVTPLRTSSIDEMEVYTPKNQTQIFLKGYKSPVRCSPILLKAYGEEYAKVRGSIGSPDKVVNLEECTSPKDPSKVLKGVTAYVEVRRAEDDRSGGFRWKLKQLGAIVSDTLNKKVTHVIFQEGLLSTFRKAKQLGAHLVSTHWVMACDESFTKVQEARYPIEKLSHYDRADPLLKSIKRPKIMSPDLGSGRDDKSLSRRLQRRSIKVSSPLTQMPLRSMKTPSPVKSFNCLKRITPSPKSKQNSIDNSDDDWDGFLAMVETQVREKAESRRKSGEINETIESFETRLQRLLGRGDPQAESGASPPLASIFEKRKVSSSVQETKSCPKKIKKTKPGLNLAGSSSVMMNWLQRSLPDTGKMNKNQDLSSASAADAASAAADKILESMFKFVQLRGETECESLNKVSKTSQSETRMRSRAETLSQNSTAKGSSQEPFAFTARAEQLKLSHPVKKLTKKKKLEFEGSAGCSGAMRNWLSGVKSPTVPNKSSVGTAMQGVRNSPSKDESTRKRKALFSEDYEIDLISRNNYTDFEPVNQCKKHCGEVTPEKKSPLKGNGSAIKSDRKTLMNVTPRRRSMRLTPIKSTPLLSNITQLKTLEESEVSTFQSTVATPKEAIFGTSYS